MRIVSSRRLRGPNRYLDRPVLVVRLDLAELTDRESVEFPGFAERLLAVLPGLADHHCAAGEPGGFTGRLRDGTYFGHITEHVALELSVRIGREVTFGRTRSAGRPGEYDVVVECARDEPPGSPVPEELFRLALALVADVLAGRVPEVDAPLAALRAEYERGRPGPSTAALAAAARARGIPVERIEDLGLLRLGYGRLRRLIWATMTDRTSGVAVDIAGDKQLTRQLLAEAGLPVPPGGPAATPAEALRLFAELGAPVVVKPRGGRQGRGVFLGLDTPAAVEAAFGSAIADRAAMVGDGAQVVVERHLPGRDYRVLVVDGVVVAAAERIAAHVRGDGTHDVAGLVEVANADPRRGTGHDRPLTRLAVDEAGAATLAAQGYRLDSVPAAGEVVWLRGNANLSTGGTSRDVTDEVHPDVAEVCRRAVAVIGLDVAGIDLRLPDIGVPLPATAADAGPAEGVSAPAGGIIEVNAAPGLRMHLAPSSGSGRDVASVIVDVLFPPGARGRIPTVAVTGTNGKTTTARLTAHLLAGAGLRVGLTTTDGVYIDGRLVQRADATGPRSAHVVLGDPTIDAAVLETARGGILRQGIGYDWTDVGVITNIANDHLGQDGLHTIEDLVDVKALVAERVRDGGTLVLNGDDPRVRSLVERPATRAAAKRLVWFSALSNSPLLARHCGNGGWAYVIADGWLVERAAERWLPLLSAAEVPGTFGGAARYAAANALAALAAARALDLPTALAVERLRTFPAIEANPGRGMVLRVDGVDLFVDYAHNPAAIAAVTEVLHRIWGRKRTVAAVTLPGDRRDDLLAESARVLADGVDRIVLYEDTDRRGRAAGEVPELLRREIELRRPGTPCVVTRTLTEAVSAALGIARPGDVVLLLYESVPTVLDLLAGMGAATVPVPAGEPLPIGVDPLQRIHPSTVTVNI